MDRGQGSNASLGMWNGSSMAATEKDITAMDQYYLK